MNDNSPRAKEALDERMFLRRVFIVLGVVVLALLVWELERVFLLAFAGVLVAIILRAIADALVRWIRIPERWSLLAAGILVIIAVAGLIALLGAQAVAQFEQLSNTLPATFRSLSEQLNSIGGGIGAGIQSQLTSGVGALMSQLASAGLIFVNGITDAVLIVFAGVFLAADPGTYRRGVVMLFPAGVRPRVSDMLANASSALRLWLLGTMASMALVSLFTGLGLWAIGAPAPLALGLLAGFAEFVSFLGPIFSGVVAMLAASSAGLDTVVWTLVVMIAIQQIESNFITPLIQQRAVDLPPVVALLGIVAFGILFGILGIILAVPLSVVALVAVKQLYVRETLGEPTEVPGEAERQEQEHV